MDDATLVEAARSGDGGAWAAIYDRYADKLHDHCHRILRDRDEAADALHDAFIAAARNLHQLREPSRLRPWLYAICRHESLRRAKHRSRVELTDEVDDMRSVDVDLDRGTSAEELQELVWSAAAGLNERDQALLDLNLRQGLDGQDLADAMGTSLSNSYVLMSRLRDQVERSLGALLIARLGREDCEELDGILVGWDGRFTPLLRKRVARHVDGCEVCSERRAAVLSPMALLAAAPLVPAPAALRERVLAALDRGEAAPISFNRAGFASASAGTDRRRRSVWWLAVAAALVAALLAAVAILPDSEDVLAVDAAPTTTDEPATSSTTASSTSLPVAPPTTDAATPPPTTPPVIAPPTSAPDVDGPAVAGVTSSEPALDSAVSTGCGTTTTSQVTALVTDPSGIDAVTLHWSTPGEGAGSKAMTVAGDQWSGQLGPFTTVVSPSGTDQITWWVIAQDLAGNTTRTVDRSTPLSIVPC